MALIRTAEQSAALKNADFTGVLRSMPQPGLRTATCLAFGHPDGEGDVELVRIPYEEFWELIKASSGIREEIVNEVERRRKEPHRLPVIPDVKGSSNALFADDLVPLGLYQGQSLMLIDLDRCTRCDECVKACVDTHQDGRSRLFLAGPTAYIGDRTFLVPTTCQSCEDPVCMIGCPTRAIRRGDKGEMIIDEKSCIGCEGCARKCPYNAIQMHDLGLVSAPGYLRPRVAGPKAKQKDEPAKSHDWYCFPAAEIGEEELAAWRTQTAPPEGWLNCTLPLAFHRGLRESLAAVSGRSAGSAISANEPLCFWRAFSIPLDRKDWDGQVVVDVESAPDSFRFWIDGQEIRPGSGKTNAWERRYHHNLPISARKGWRWWRKQETHVLALQVVPNCDPGGTFLHVWLDAVRPPRGPWDILDDITEKTKKPKLAVVCDLCGTSRGGPACIRACPHDATTRFDARAGMKDW
jgi:Fe-S-cluster-containing hydrogenase component 2